MDFCECYTHHSTYKKTSYITIHLASNGSYFWELHLVYEKKIFLYVLFSSKLGSNIQIYIYIVFCSVLNVNQLLFCKLLCLIPPLEAKRYCKEKTSCITVNLTYFVHTAVINWILLLLTIKTTKMSKIAKKSILSFAFPKWEKGRTEFLPTMILRWVSVCLEESKTSINFARRVCVLRNKRYGQRNAKKWLKHTFLG